MPNTKTRTTSKSTAATSVTITWHRPLFLSTDVCGAAENRYPDLIDGGAVHFGNHDAGEWIVADQLDGSALLFKVSDRIGRITITQVTDEVSLRAVGRGYASFATAERKRLHAA